MFVVTLESLNVELVAALDKTSPKHLEYTEAYAIQCNSVTWTKDGRLITSGYQNLTIFDDNLTVLKSAALNTEGMSVAEQGSGFVVMTFSTAQPLTTYSPQSVQISNYLFSFYSNDLKLIKNFETLKGITSAQYYRDEVYGMTMIHQQIVFRPSSSLIIASDSKSGKLKIFTKDGDLFHHIETRFSDPRCLHALPDESVIISFRSGHVRKFEVKPKEAVLIWEFQLPPGVAGISSDSAGYIYVAGSECIYILSADGMKLSNE